MSAKASDYHKRLSEFITDHVFPAEAEYDKYRAGSRSEGSHRPAGHRGTQDQGQGGRTVESVPAVRIRSDQPRVRAAGRADRVEPGDRARGDQLRGARTPAIWKPCTCSPPRSSASSGWSHCSTARSAARFSMTEPAVASSDARNIETSIVRDGADYVINGRKWWTSGAADPRCKILIVMGRTNPEAASHQQQSMVLVPIDTPGVTVVRSTSGLRLAGPARALRNHLRQRPGAGPPTCSARKAPASRSPRHGSGRAASITACVRWVERNARWP